jgi:hypothetical protein
MAISLLESWDQAVKQAQDEEERKRRESLAGLAAPTPLPDFPSLVPPPLTPEQDFNALANAPSPFAVPTLTPLQGMAAQSDAAFAAKAVPIAQTMETRFPKIENLKPIVQTTKTIMDTTGRVLKKEITPKPGLPGSDFFNLPGGRAIAPMGTTVPRLGGPPPPGLQKPTMPGLIAPRQDSPGLLGELTGQARIAERQRLEAQQQVWTDYNSGVKPGNAARLEGRPVYVPPDQRSAEDQYVKQAAQPLLPTTGTGRNKRVTTQGVDLATPMAQEALYSLEADRNASFMRLLGENQASWTIRANAERLAGRGGTADQNAALTKAINQYMRENPGSFPGVTFDKQGNPRMPALSRQAVADDAATLRAMGIDPATMSLTDYLDDLKQGYFSTGEGAKQGISMGGYRPSPNADPASVALTSNVVQLVAVMGLDAGIEAGMTKLGITNAAARSIIKTEIINAAFQTGSAVGEGKPGEISERILGTAGYAAILGALESKAMPLLRSMSPGAQAALAVPHSVSSLALGYGTLNWIGAGGKWEDHVRGMVPLAVGMGLTGMVSPHTQVPLKLAKPGMKLMGETFYVDGKGKPGEVISETKHSVNMRFDGDKIRFEIPKRRLWFAPKGETAPVEAVPGDMTRMIVQNGKLQLAPKSEEPAPVESERGAAGIPPTQENVTEPSAQPRTRVEREVELATKRTTTEYTVSTIDEGIQKIRVMRHNDGSVTIMGDNKNGTLLKSEYNKEFSVGKSDEEIIKYALEPLGEPKIVTGEPMPASSDNQRAVNDVIRGIQNPEPEITLTEKPQAAQPPRGGEQTAEAGEVKTKNQMWLAGEIETWQMTQSEMLASDAYHLRYGAKSSATTPAGMAQQTKKAINGHVADIEQALRDGKPVPAEVLADYPDLAAKPAQQGQAPAREGEAKGQAQAGGVAPPAQEAPPAAAATREAAGKEPWEMSKAEYKEREDAAAAEYPKQDELSTYKVRETISSLKKRLGQARGAMYDANSTSAISKVRSDIAKLEEQLAAAEGVLKDRMDNMPAATEENNRKMTDFYNKYSDIVNLGESGDFKGAKSALFKGRHKDLVEAAAREGKFGAGILDYPELQKQYQPAAAPSGEGAPAPAAVAPPAATGAKGKAEAKTYTPPKGASLYVEPVRSMTAEGWVLRRNSEGTTYGKSGSSYEEVKAIADKENIRMSEAETERRQWVAEQDAEKAARVQQHGASGRQYLGGQKSGVIGRITNKQGQSGKLSLRSNRSANGYTFVIDGRDTSFRLDMSEPLSQEVKRLEDYYGKGKNAMKVTLNAPPEVRSAEPSPVAKPTPPPAPAPPPRVAPARRGKALPSVEAISDFRPGIDKVIRIGDRTFIHDSKGSYADREVQSDKLTPEGAQKIRDLAVSYPTRFAEFRQTTAATPKLSPEGKAERLAVFDEVMGAKPPAPALAAPKPAAATKATGAKPTSVADVATKPNTWKPKIIESLAPEEQAAFDRILNKMGRISSNLGQIDAELLADIVTVGKGIYGKVKGDLPLWTAEMKEAFKNGAVEFRDSIELRLPEIFSMVKEQADRADGWEKPPAGQKTSKTGNPGSRRGSRY